MKWKTLSKIEADSIMQKWSESPDQCSDEEYAEIRKDFMHAAEKTLTGLALEKNQIKGHEYQIDLRFALQVYEVLWIKYKFTARDASNDGIWRYLSVKVVPDLVFMRWGNNPNRYWKESRRIWLKALWWYIHLSWQGDSASTYKTLKNNTADEIVQLVERSGSLGYRIDLTRSIMKYYGALPVDKKKRGQQIFRRVMKLNTAAARVVEPALLIGGEGQYVKELFEYFD